jgi:hypothetical protein
MQDLEYWISFWRIVGIVIVSIALSITGCTAHSNKIIADMVEGGAEPIEAYCSISFNTGGSMCIITATKAP